MLHLFKMLKWFAILALVFGLAFLVYVAVKINEPLKTLAKERVFTLTPGWTSRQVAKSLEEKGFISRAFFFEIYVGLKKQGTRLQAGEYLLSEAMSIKEIAGRLTEGQALANEVRLTVIEGWTANDIAKGLAEKGLDAGPLFYKDLRRPDLFSDDFPFLKENPKNSTLEGFLFPDTYLFAEEDAGHEILRKMLANFEKKVLAEIGEEMGRQGKSLYEIVTLASIIEREVGRNLKRGEKLGASELEKLKEERRQVASVFENRLKIGKPLESDATISYITGRKGSRQATFEETKIDSPYNTYRYKGLPPGPISNPSLDSIRAAIEPAKTDYLFFVTAPDGTAYFAKTLEEHIANREKYLK